MSKSTMDDVFAPVEAKYKAEVMYETWGHLDAKIGEVHAGWFVFIHGQHGDLAVLESDFPTFGEGPGYFMHREDFIWSKVKNDGPCSKVGVYRFEGTYRLNKKTGSGTFTGKVRRVRLNPPSKKPVRSVPVPKPTAPVAPQMTWGTCHYANEKVAKAAYGADYAGAIAEGRICVGRPAIKPGQRLTLDLEGRYFITG